MLLRGLGPRHQEVAMLVLSGHCNLSIGTILNISERTSKHYVSELMEHTGTTSRASFMAKCYQKVAGKTMRVIMEELT